MAKLLIASDLHGSAYYTKLLMDRIGEEKADRILLLGDLLYHGPRNDLPRDYAPKEVITMLNSIKNEVLCVRGNCDTEVDQMVLDFPIMADYAVLILLNGHTHVPVLHVREDFIFMNPGSVSIPKDGSCHSYMTLEDGNFFWKDVESGKSFMQFG